MDRREAIKRVALLMGGALSAPAVAGVLSGCRSGTSSTTWSPQTLSAEESELVTVISEMILPETDTPGAKAAGVNEFVDLMMTEWYPADERDAFLAGLADVDARAQQAHGTTFVHATPEQQAEILSALDDEAVDVAASGAEKKPFFRTMKELTLLGYYTSEIGASQELQWIAAPGYFDGCVPMGEIGRAWA